MTEKRKPTILTKERILKSKNWTLTTWNDKDLDILIPYLKPNSAGLSYDLVKLIESLVTFTYKNWDICKRYNFLRNFGSKRTKDYFNVRYGEIEGGKIFLKKENNRNKNSILGSKKKDKIQIKKNKIKNILRNKKIKGFVDTNLCTDSELIDICSFHMKRTYINKFRISILKKVKQKKMLHFNHLKLINIFIKNYNDNWIKFYDLYHKEKSAYKKLLLINHKKLWRVKNIISENTKIGFFGIFSIGNREKIKKCCIFKTISKKNITKIKLAEKNTFSKRIENLIDVKTKLNSNLYFLSYYGNKIGSEKINLRNSVRKTQGISIKKRNNSKEVILRKHLDNMCSSIEEHILSKLIDSEIYNKIKSYGWKELDNIIFDMSQYTTPTPKLLKEYFYSRRFNRMKIRYGEEKFLLMAKDSDLCYNNKKIEKLSGKKASKESLDIFVPIMNDILKNKPKTNIFLAYGNRREYRISEYINNEYKSFFYDFTLPEYKLIIEYNGSAWHPNINNNFDNWKDVTGRFTAIEKYQYDRNKIKIAENNGFNVIEIWDTETKENNIKNIISVLQKIGALDVTGK